MQPVHLGIRDPPSLSQSCRGLLLDSRTLAFRLGIGLRPNCPSRNGADSITYCGHPEIRERASRGARASVPVRLDRVPLCRLGGAPGSWGPTRRVPAAAAGLTAIPKFTVD